MEHEHIGISVDAVEQLTDPAAVQGRDGVRVTEEQTEHDDHDHCGVGTDGRAAVDIRTDDDEIDECKRAAENGSDEWRVAWLDALPDGVSPPDGGPRSDLELVLE
jgi:hypothetical protein